MGVVEYDDACIFSFKENALVRSRKQLIQEREKKSPNSDIGCFHQHNTFWILGKSSEYILLKNIEKCQEKPSLAF